MERIVVGYDDSAGARSALTWAVQYAKRTASELVVVYVVSEAWEWELAAVQVNTDPLRKEFERRLRGEWTADARAAGVQYRTELEVGNPAEALLAAARRNAAALIVVGMSKGGAISELMRGSASHHMMQHAVRPIVTVPAGWESSSVIATGDAEARVRSTHG
jgi:nucleotide-binding universal stress UspA family protein